DDVHVGHDETGRIDHHARAERALHLLLLAPLQPEEASEERIVEKRIVVLHHLGGIDVDHSRLYALHDRRKGKPELGSRRWNATVLRLGEAKGCDQGKRAKHKNGRTDRSKHNYLSEKAQEYRRVRATIEGRQAQYLALRTGCAGDHASH